MTICVSAMSMLNACYLILSPLTLIVLMSTFHVRATHQRTLRIRLSSQRSISASMGSPATASRSSPPGQLSNDHHGHSALMLVAARLRHIASTKWGKRRYLVMETLLNPAKQEAAA